MSPRTCALVLAAAILALARPARSAEPAGPDPSELLGRARAAQGGAAWDGIHGLRLQGTLQAGGLSGPIESLIDPATGRFRDRWQLGPVRGANGWDGTRAWSQDASGVARVDGAEASRRLAVTEAYRRAQGWRAPAQHPAEIRPLGERRDGERPFQVLQLTPAGGSPFELWIAPDGTFDRWVEVVDGRTLTTFLSDWREVRGVKVPFVQRLSRGEAERQHDQLVTWAEVAPVPAPDEAAFALPAPPAPDFGFRSKKRQATVPFQLVNGHIYADVRLDGKGPFRLLVDTGGVNVVTPEVAKVLGLDAQGALPGGGVGDQTEDVAVGRVGRVELGDAWVKDQTFYVFPLDALEPVEGAPLQGLVGYEVFSRFAARIDYAGRRLTLYHPEVFRYDGPGAVLPFEFHEHVPQVEGAIDGVPGKFDLDTGSRASLDLFAPFVEAHGLAARYGAGVERIGGWGVGGPSRTRLVRAGALRLGPVEIPGPVTGLSTQKKGAFAAQAVAGNVGAGVLSRFTVFLDYPRQRVILEKGRGFERPDPADRSGLWLHRASDGFEVMEVVPGTPAAEAGLVVGDRIIAVEGRGPGRLTLHQLRTELRERPAGTRVALRVRRGAEELRLTLVLRDLL